jgi:hypothetical protein
MTIDQTRPATTLFRRRLRRVAGVVGSLVPLGFLGQCVWESRQAALPVERTNRAICPAAAAAAILVPRAPKAKPGQLAVMRRSRTRDHQPTGPDLTREIALHAEELNESRSSSGSDTGRFASGVAANGLAS